MPDQPTARIRSEAGFTISEVVLVSVFVIGLLLIAFTSVRNIRRETATSDCQTELRTLKLATEQYHAQFDTYPVDTSTLVVAKLAKAGDIDLWTLQFTSADKAPTYEPAGSDCT